jgi:hypothetical protein
MKKSTTPKTSAKSRIAARSPRRAATSHRSPMASPRAANANPPASRDFLTVPHPRPTWTHVDARPIPTNNLVGVFLKSLQVHTDSFRSDQYENKREGAVSFSCCGQMTVHTFNDSRNELGRDFVALKGSSLLFLGLHPRRLSLGIQVMESDEEVRKALDKTSKVFQAISGSSAAKLHSAIAPGAGLIAGLLTTIKSTIVDDQEYQFFAVYDDAITHGMTLAVVGQNLAGNRVVEASLEVVDLGESRAGNPVSVRVATPTITFHERKIAGRERRGTDWASRRGAGLWPLSKTPRQWIDHLGAHWFSCESANGKSRFSYTARLGEAVETVHWHKAELFIAPTGSNSARVDRHLISFSLAFTLVPRELKPDVLLGLAGQALDVATALGASTDLLKDYLTKADSTLGPVLSHLTGKTIDLFSFEGLLFLLPEGAPDPDDQRLLNLPGILPLFWSPATQVWKSDPAGKSQDIEYQGKTIGSIQIEIEARALKEIK